MVDSNLSANFRSAETTKLSTKRVSAPDPEHPFQTRFRESLLNLGTGGDVIGQLHVRPLLSNYLSISDGN